jgi:DNA-binding NtrC family response regulator
LTATNGQEALQVYRANRAGIAVVLADLVMPELDGIGLLRALQADDPQVKIIIMSGYPQRGPVDELIAEGVMEWVQKPPRLNQLAHALRRTL